MKSHPWIEPLLQELYPFLTRLNDPWWLIGSGSLYLQGIDIDVDDLDILTSTRDAKYLITQLAPFRIDVVKENSDRFQSEFGAFRIQGHTVEVMGDLKVKVGDRWEVLRIEETELIQFGKMTLPVPSLKDQIRMYKLFNREKDRTKIEQIKRNPC